MQRGDRAKTRQARLLEGNIRAGDEADRLEPRLGNHADLGPSWWLSPQSSQALVCAIGRLPQAGAAVAISVGRVAKPGSAHRPAATGGVAHVLYLLPEGEIEFTGA